MYAIRSYYGEVGLEDLSEILLRNADAGIGDDDANVIPSSLGADRKSSPIRHGRHRILDKVEEGLLDIPLVVQKLRQAVRQLHAGLYVV